MNAKEKIQLTKSLFADEPEKSMLILERIEEQINKAVVIAMSPRSTIEQIRVAQGIYHAHVRYKKFIEDALS